MPLLDKKSGQIFYDVKGQGEPLVLLRGLGRSSAYWLGFDQMLAKHFTVITTDARGLGKTTIETSWFNAIEDAAADVISILDRLCLPSAHIFGLSLGGMVGLHLGKVQKHRVSSLMVANTSTADYPGLRVNPISLARLFRPSFKRDFQSRLADALISHTVAKSHVDHIKKLWRILEAEEGIRVSTICKQLISASRFKLGSEGINPVIPIAIFYGTRDRFVPTANSLRLLELIPQAAAYPIDFAGHEITAGNEERLIQLILKFTKNSAPQENGI